MNPHHDSPLENALIIRAAIIAGSLCLVGAMATVATIVYLVKGVN